MDEYVNLARDHPESYHSFMWRHLFSHIDIKYVMQRSGLPYKVIDFR